MQYSTKNKTTLVGAAYATKAMSIDALLIAASQRDPLAIAVVDGDRKLTWTALMQQVDTGFHNINALGLPPGSAIATYMRRSIEWIVMMLAIWRAGHVYVPLNKKNPEARNRQFLRQADARCVLVERTDVGVFAHSIEIAQILAQVDPQIEGAPVSHCSIDACYMFTSGSTGEPKVIRYAQRDLSEFIQSFKFALELDQDAVISGLQFCECSFDAHLLETLLALTTGGCLCLLEKSEFVGLAEYVDVIERNQVNTLIPPTTFWHQWSAAVAARASYFPGCVRTVLVGGEKPIPKYFCGDHIPETLTVFNGYGPAEGLVCSSVQPTGKAMLVDDGDIPAGLPTPNKKISIIDANLCQVDDGEIGEIFLHGQGLAAGYKNADSLADQQFTQIVIGGNSCFGYRTGDAGFVGDDGRLHFAGRIDSQIKINGKRFEPGEVEQKMLEWPTVTNAVVLLHQRDDIKTLVGFVEATEALLAVGVVDQVREFLKTALPDHMVPTHCLGLVEFPRTLNGKIDRKALSQHYERQLDLVKQIGEQSDGPSDAIELAVLKCWDTCIGKRYLHGSMMDVNFLDVENSSLSRGIFLAELLHEFELEHAYAQFLACTTLRQIAKQIKNLS